MTREQDKLVGTRNFRDALSYTDFTRGVFWRSDRIPSHPTSGDLAKIKGLGVTDLIDFSGGSDPKLKGVTTHELPITLVGDNKQQKYRDGIRSKSKREKYGRGLKIMARVKGATVFHCKEGKDRTGEEDAFLLEVLGAPRDAIYANYMRSRAYLGPTVVYRSWLDAMYSEIAKLYGHGPDGVQKFIRAGLLLTEDDIARLRAKAPLRTPAAA